MSPNWGMSLFIGWLKVWFMSRVAFSFTKFLPKFLFFDSNRLERDPVECCQELLDNAKPFLLSKWDQIIFELNDLRHPWNIHDSLDEKRRPVDTRKTRGWQGSFLESRLTQKCFWPQTFQRLDRRAMSPFKQTSVTSLILVATSPIAVMTEDTKRSFRQKLETERRATYGSCSANEVSVHQFLDFGVLAYDTLDHRREKRSQLDF